MKKIIVSLMLVVMAASGAYAQFEKGKVYCGASMSGLGISYDENKKLSFGVSGQVGYMFEEAWMAVAEVGLDYSDSNCNELSAGAKCRYYIEQNGLFLGAGLKYTYETKNINDLKFTPEVGYCFFLNRHAVIEPSVYYNMSLTDFDDKSRFGLKVGFGFFF